ncbi:hypothetical protein [uncultured Corynebacterium sp.]|uniref:hypothetical protein n=1 Tax=uncultured Corynebacterium sp. TaxID=159447 RepID=UPI0025FC98F8|nr:hypothetical protein [uncultured Corynebacterium sp.]
MSASHRRSLLRRLAVGTLTVGLSAGLTTGVASAAPSHGDYKASLGHIFSCSEHNYPWC